MKERIENVLKKKDSYKDILTEWDQGFLESLLRWIESGHNLSTKQHNMFAKIEGKLSESNIEAYDTWNENWDDNKKEIARVCAEYYSRTGYYSGISRRILNEPEWVVPRTVFMKLTENKYAKKVVEAYFSKPLYENGDTVMLRSGARAHLSYRDYKKMAEQPLFIMGVVPFIRSAAKNSKIYNVIAPGSIQPVEIEERYIKKWKKPKKKAEKDKIYLPF